MRNALLGSAALVAAIGCAPAHAQQGGGGSGVPCSQASFLLTYGCAVDEQTPSQLHTDLTAPLGLDTNGGIGPIEVLQTAPTGGNITTADSGSTVTTSGSHGGQSIVTGTPTTGSAIAFTFPNGEGVANFNITGFSASLGTLTAAAGASWTTATPTITMAATCPSSVVAGQTVVDTTLTPNVPIGTVSSCSSTTLTLNANATYASSGSGDTLEFTGGGAISECSPDNAHWSQCPVSVAGQNDVFTINGNVIGGRVVASGFKYWRLRNTASVQGTGAVTAVLSPIGNLPNYPQTLSPTSTPANLTSDNSQNLNVSQGMSTVAGTPVTWTPTTPVNTTLTIANLNGMQGATVDFYATSCTSPLGVITAQFAYGVDNTGALIWQNAANTQIRLVNGAAGVNPYAQTNGTNTPQWFDLHGARAFQLKLTTALSGTGPCSVTVSANLYPYLMVPQGVSATTVGPPGMYYFNLTYPQSGYPTNLNGSPSPTRCANTGSTSAVTCTIAAGGSGVFNFLCGYHVSAIGGTAAIGPFTITNVQGGTLTRQGSSTAAGADFSEHFWPCLQGSAANTNMVMTTTADGTATAVDIEMSGYANAQ